MNIRASLPGRGMSPAVAAEIGRIEDLWRQCRARAGKGDFLFGPFGAADAMFAPVVMRFATYGPPLAAESLRYCAAMRETRSFRAWVASALLEKEVVAEDEPYATTPD